MNDTNDKEIQKLINDILIMQRENFFQSTIRIFNESPDFRIAIQTIVIAILGIIAASY